MSFISLKLHFLLFLLMSAVSLCYGISNNRHQLFHRVRKGGYLKARNVISTFMVGQKTECSFHCMKIESCVAFNFRPAKCISEENCQIAKNTVDKMHEDNDDVSNEDNNWTLYRRLNTANQRQCEGNWCKNGGKCIITGCNRPDCFRCKCTFKYKGKFCQKGKVFSSCKQIFDRYSEAKSGDYKIRPKNESNSTKVYCEMTSLGECAEGGWTLMMKINGSQSTFNYSSKYWSNKKSYNPKDGLTFLDQKETKLALYHSLPFKEMCLGMAVNGNLSFVFLPLTTSVSSLYKVIKNKEKLTTNLSTNKWRSLIEDSSLQNFSCKQGFNLESKACPECSRVRLGIVADECNDCRTPDSFIGFGGKGSTQCDDEPVPTQVSCGNLARCKADNGAKEIHAFCYILVR